MLPKAIEKYYLFPSVPANATLALTHVNLKEIAISWLHFSMKKWSLPDLYRESSLDIINIFCDQIMVLWSNTFSSPLERTV
jgi:hypothetical protein